MFNLFKNEWIKLWNKKQAWIYLGSVSIITFIVAIFIWGVPSTIMGTSLNEDNWEEKLQEDINEAEVVLENENSEAFEIQSAEALIEENEDYLSLGVNPMETNNLIFLSENFLIISSFVTLFSVIISSSIVSSEIEKGTIKNLLILPIPRWKILLSKFMTVIMFSLSLIFTIIIIGLSLGAILFGSGELSSPIIIGSSIDNRELAPVIDVLSQRIILYLLNLIMFIIIAFFVSIFFRSQTLAVGISIFLMFSANVIRVFASSLESFSWYPYLLIPHLSLPRYVLVDEILPNVGFIFSLSIFTVYSIIFVSLTFYYFERKDFTN